MLTTILKKYRWQDHPEGIKFVETHRNQYRSSGHWLFLAGDISYFHKVANNEELWFIHQGKLRLHLIRQDGGYEKVVLGHDLAAGELPVTEITANCWVAAEVLAGEKFAFGTNVCAPPFSFDEFIMGQQQRLLQQFPQHEELIKKFTKDV